MFKVSNEMFQMPTANVGQTVSANQISVPQSARRDAVAMTVSMQCTFIIIL